MALSARPNKERSLASHSTSDTCVTSIATYKIPADRWLQQTAPANTNPAVLGKCGDNAKDNAEVSNSTIVQLLVQMKHSFEVRPELLHAVVHLLRT
jgi:hypothetical protein